MKEIIFITGGQRSGKSRYAQSLAENLSANPIYLATARRWDEDFEKRIARHRQDRGSQWRTIEEEKELSKLKLEGQTVLLDCITLWLTNIYHDCEYNLDESLALAKKEWNSFIEQEDVTLLVVSNEIGMCLHAPDEASRHFTDLQGWMNQHIASLASHVYVMISGMPLQLK